MAAHNLTTNPLLTKVTQEDRNLIMACYATFLLMGNTLLCNSIAVDTVKKYMLAVKDFFIDNNQWDPCITKQGKTASVLTSVYREGKRWESMPNRQEPLTIEMTQHLISKAKSSYHDSPEAAIADWSIVGLQSGPRSSEWCQSNSKQILPITANFKKNVDGSATAFIAGDFVLKNKHKRPIFLTPSLDHTTVAFVSTRWRYQKNGDNGQIITYARNLDNPELCYVSAVIRILSRAQRLAIKPDCPVAVAMAGKKKLFPCFITSTLVASHLQAAAKAVHHIISKKDLARFSTHSLRVGACVLLHTNGKLPHYIKLRLRWRSDSYKDYLRDVAMLATEHAAVIHRAVTAIQEATPSLS